ncbi:MAG: Zn-ribbon domain-containing OB-fold protein [Myxococcales bacterium]|nr:Zn-ribbon domain-containing OB-fold protein [Myxococcales bacterium]
MSPTLEKALTAPHKLEYTYKRSLGPVLSPFFTALRDRRILGVKRRDGRVMVPPKEYDPDTSESLDELVEVSDEGVVTSWSWVATPRRQQPLDRPFAYALVKLDGADTALLHVVDAGDEGNMETGMRVKARWADETTGMITDFVFVPA